MIGLAWSLIACRTLPPAIVQIEVLPPSPGVFLARELSVELSEDAPLQITLTDPARERRVWSVPSARTHTIPVFTLHAETTYRIEARIAEGPGEGAQAEVELVTQALPQPFPIVEVLANERAALEPGHTLLPINDYNGTASYAAVFDEAWRPVYVFDAGRHWTDARLLPDGTLLVVAKPSVEQLDLFGRDRVTWGDGPGEIPVGVGVLHHDALPHEGGLLTIAHASLEVPAYPTSYADPLDLAPATLRDDVVLHLDRDGTVLRSRALSDLLDETRISWDSLSPEPEGLDWAHTNAVSPTDDGGLLISCRNQDVLLRVDADWQLSWILGSSSGFGEDWREHFLRPIGEAWIDPQHQHGPELHPDGRLYVFDNGDRGFTPYDGGLTPQLRESRLLALQIDEARGTVEELWSWRHPAARLWSGAMGDADLQPQTGNVIGVWGFVGEEDGIANTDLGFGARTARIAEIDPALSEPLLDVRLRSDPADNPDGYFVYRAQRIAPLHTQPALLPEG